MQTASGPILTAAETRAAEEAAIASGASVTDLMERAGAEVAEATWRFGSGDPVLIACGPGNNGGDGYVAARLLKARGVDVRVAMLRPPRAPAAINAASKWDGPVEALLDARPAPILIDAVFGTGLNRPLEVELSAALDRLRNATRFCLAVDLPTGVETDTGCDLGSAGADATLALGWLKPAHLLQPAAGLCGALQLTDIGVKAKSPVSVLERPCLSAPTAAQHKYSRGFAVVVGGNMSGAAMLSAKAAMRIAGYVAIVGARRTGPDALVHRRWEAVAGDSRVGALLIGPGLGRDAPAEAKVKQALATTHPLVLDADALAFLDKMDFASRPVILTPHEGEFAALFGPLPGSKIDRARAAAAKCGAVIILKGSDSVVAAPDGRVSVSPPAPSWLASAGTGDVLAGVALGQLAAGGDPFDAACAAVWLHAEAGRRAGPSLIGDDLIAHLPAAMATCL